MILELLTQYKVIIPTDLYSNSFKLVYLLLEYSINLIVNFRNLAIKDLFEN